MLRKVKSNFSDQFKADCKKYGKPQYGMSTITFYANGKPVVQYQGTVRREYSQQ